MAGRAHVTPRAHIHAIAARAGVRINEARDTRDGCAYNGRTIAGLIAGRPRIDSDVAHDVAHWLVAAPYRRRVVDFGLGVGPDLGASDAPMLVSVRFADREEQAASLLGIAIEVAAGIDPARTLREHDWTMGREFWRTVARLRRSGLIDECGQLVTT